MSVNRLVSLIIIFSVIVVLVPVVIGYIKRGRIDSLQLFTLAVLIFTVLVNIYSFWRDR